MSAYNDLFCGIPPLKDSAAVSAVPSSAALVETWLIGAAPVAKVGLAAADALDMAAGQLVQQQGRPAREAYLSQHYCPSAWSCADAGAQPMGMEDCGIAHAQMMRVNSAIHLFSLGAKAL